MMIYAYLIVFNFYIQDTRHVEVICQDVLYNQSALYKRPTKEVKDSCYYITWPKFSEENF